MPTPLEQLIDDLPMRALPASDASITGMAADTNIADLTQHESFKKAS
jgi:hypothetical protein